MAWATANGYGIGAGVLSIPRLGRPSATLRLGAGDERLNIEAGEAVQLAFQDGTAYEMTCISAGIERGLWELRLVGGAGQLSTRLRPKFYRNIATDAVLDDIISEAGERAGPLNLPGVFGYYVRAGQPAHMALEHVLEAHDEPAVWRVLSDGRLSVFVDTWPDFEDEIGVLSHQPDQRRACLQPLPQLTPGVATELGSIDHVYHLWDIREIRTEVLYL